MIDPKKILATILVFRTNICFKKDAAKVSECLRKHTGIIRWNMDLEDIDNVLRIETYYLTAEDIITIVKQCGYECDELPD